jgi:hypothetical protein
MKAYPDMFMKIKDSVSGNVRPATLARPSFRQGSGQALAVQGRHGLRCPAWQYVRASRTKMKVHPSMLVKTQERVRVRIEINTTHADQPVVEDCRDVTPHPTRAHWQNRAARATLSPWRGKGTPLPATLVTGGARRCRAGAGRALPVRR